MGALEESRGHETNEEGPAKEQGWLTAGEALGIANQLVDISSA